MDWYAPLAARQGRGATAARPGSLAGLAAARKEHQGQFFTPAPVARLMWEIAQPVFEACAQYHRSARILDNSVGSGRLLRFASADRHALFGVDTDGEAVAALSAAAAAAGFEYEFLTCGMQDITPKDFDCAFINPPFSLTLQSPWLSPYSCTAYGKFGPNTNALSHAYALAQALDAARVVVALLPTSFTEEVATDPAYNERLQAIYHLPAGAFRKENTEVRTSILVFGPLGATVPVQRQTLANLEAGPLPPVSLRAGLFAHSPKARLNARHIESGAPTITLPVTGDTSVRVSHDGRRVRLGFGCGLTQAMVLNAILREPVEHYQPDGTDRHRYPQGIRYTGQGALDLEVHLTQDDPLASFEAFLAEIRDAGGTPQVQPGVREHLVRRHRRSLRQRTPLAHTVYFPGGHVRPADDLVLGIARTTHQIDPNSWFSPVIEMGAEVSFTREGGDCYVAEIDGERLSLTAAELQARFETASEATTEGAWRQIHAGLAAAYPDLAANYRARARALGVDKWLSWDFQLEDAIECLMKPEGCVIAWEQALGKARLAAALILLSGVKHGILAVEPYLVPEMEAELRLLPIPPEAWQVITKPAHARALRTINIITYDRLRSKLADAKHQSYAKLLRRRAGLLVADEGEVLCNMDSLQTRALWQLATKRKFVLTGTPIANYPRDALPLLNFCAGDGTAAQPYGVRGLFMDERLRTSTAFAERGIDRFRDDFVTTEWVTSEFIDTLSQGAKREIPKIANLDRYRAMLAPHVKRRLVKEPAVAKFLKLPEPTEQVRTLGWNDAHLSHYLRVAEDFSEWYLQQRGDERRGSNLVALLARIQAVEIAANFPQHEGQKFGRYLPLTSKQRFAIERLAEHSRAGHKSILYAHHPGLLDLLARELEAQHGIRGVVFHGGKSIKARTQLLNDEFRYGDAPVLFANIAIAQAGLNLPQADTVFFYDRDWSFKAEDQAGKRVLRVQQKNAVLHERWHLDGGIDVYQDQLVAFKRDAFRSGLDWATPETDAVEFLHLDTILTRFAEAVAARRGVKSHELRHALAA